MGFLRELLNGWSLVIRWTEEFSLFCMRVTLLVAWRDDLLLPFLPIPSSRSRRLPVSFSLLNHPEEDPPLIPPSDRFPRDLRRNSSARNRWSIGGRRRNPRRWERMMFLRWERKKGREEKGWRDGKEEIGGLKGRRHRQKRHREG